MSNRFSYVNYDFVAATSQRDLKQQFETLEEMVGRLSKGRAKNLALTKLEEAYMWVGKAIRDDQIKRAGGLAEQVNG